LTDGLSVCLFIFIFREEATSGLAGFHAGPLSWSNWNLEMVVLVEGGKPENPEKNLRSRREPTTNSTHIQWQQTGIKPGPHWWEASHCAFPAPLSVPVLLID